MDGRPVYKIKGCQVDGIETKKYLIETEDGSKQTYASAEDTKKLAIVGKLYNVGYCIIKDDYELNFNGTLKDISVTPHHMYEATCRILNKDNVCVGYKLHSIDENKDYKISIQTVWTLALNNSIKGIEATVINNKRALRSCDGFSIDSLPIIIA